MSWFTSCVTTHIVRMWRYTRRGGGGLLYLCSDVRPSVANVVPQQVSLWHVATQHQLVVSHQWKGGGACWGMTQLDCSVYLCSCAAVNLLDQVGWAFLVVDSRHACRRNSHLCLSHCILRMYNWSFSTPLFPFEVRGGGKLLALTIFGQGRKFVLFCYISDTGVLTRTMVQIINYKEIPVGFVGHDFLQILLWISISRNLMVLVMVFYVDFQIEFRLQIWGGQSFPCCSVSWTRHHP